MISHFRHQKLGPWNGTEFEAKYKSTGGCSALGFSSDGELSLVYKATESSGGVYRTLVDGDKTYHDYQYPLLTTEIPELRKYFSTQEFILITSIFSY